MHHFSRLLAPIVFALSPALVQAGAPTSDEELSQQLRRTLAIHSPLNERRLDLLGALRGLHDERLRLLFADMAATPDRETRAQGLLALGELSPEGTISLAMVGEVKDPAEQGAIVLRAMAVGLIGDDQLASVLAWPRLDPRLEVALRSRLMSRERDEKKDGSQLAAPPAGAPGAPARLRELSLSSQAGAALGAFVLLAQIGDTTAQGAFLSRVAELPAEKRTAALSQAFELVRRDRHAAAAPLIEGVIAMPGIDADEREEALLTLLRVAPEPGRAAWLKEWRQAKGSAPRIRLALIALGDSESCDGTIAASLSTPGNEPLLLAMGSALAAVNGPDPERANDQLLELVKQNHPLSSAWVVSKARDLPHAQASKLLTRLIDLLAQGRRPGEEVSKLLYESAWRLGEFDPGALGSEIAAACRQGDPLLCEALLAAALRDCTAPLWDPAAGLPFPSRTTEAMAILYEARTNGLVAPAKPTTTDAAPKGPQPVHSSGGGFPSDPVKAEKLRQVALGWGNLPEVYRSLAAWLALCQDGQDREALARVLAPDSAHQ